MGVADCCHTSDTFLPRTHTHGTANCCQVSQLAYLESVVRVFCHQHIIFFFWAASALVFSFSVLFLASFSLPLLLNIGNSCHIVVTLLLAPLLLLLLSSDNNFALLFFRGGNVASPFVIALR